MYDVRRDDCAAEPTKRASEPSVSTPIAGRSMTWRGVGAVARDLKVSRREVQRLIELGWVDVAWRAGGEGDFVWARNPLASVDECRRELTSAIASPSGTVDALRYPGSALSVFLRRHFPNRQHRSGRRLPRIDTPVLTRPVSTDEYEWRVVGIAADLRFGLYFDATKCGGAPPYQTPHEAMSLIHRLRPVKRRLGAADEDLLCRCCFVIAGDLQRRQTRTAGRAPLGTTESRVSFVDRMARVPLSTIDDLRELSYGFWQFMHKKIAERAYVHPSFVGSPDVGGAQADLILRNVLIDYKTTVSAEVPDAWIDQLLAYVLLDYDDAFEIRAIEIYWARQRCARIWALRDLLEERIGFAPPLLSELRECLRSTLRGDSTKGLRGTCKCVAARRPKRRPRRYVYAGVGPYDVAVVRSSRRATLVQRATGRVVPPADINGRRRTFSNAGDAVAAACAITGVDRSTVPITGNIMPPPPWDVGST